LQQQQFKLKQTIIKNSFYCGIITFAVNYLFFLSNKISPLLIFSNLLPGLVYAIVLCDFVNNKLDLNRFLFIIFSGVLYVLVVWLASSDSIFGFPTNITLPVASITGATVLVALYYLLLDKYIYLLKGLLFAIFVGLTSCIIPFIGDRWEQKINDYDVKGNISMIFTLLIFPVWQTLFGWAIHKLKIENFQKYHTYIKKAD
jgi:hypothetical protein